MEALQGEAVSLGMEHFGKAQLGDRRRTRRLVQTVDRMLSRPGGTLPDKLRGCVGDAFQGSRVVWQGGAEG
ncbi:MAG: transposase DNA-binding-containing protein [Planctomycetota bacterium]